MLQLTRTVRFAVNDPAPVFPGPAPRPSWGDANNTFAGYPSMRGMGRAYELDITCEGEVDPVSGYFLNIKEIDQAARATIIPSIESACLSRPWDEPAPVLVGALGALVRAIHPARVRSVRWRLSPYYSVEVSPAAPNVALIRQQFEFAASHRLHVPSVSDERNRQLFGKCNNPSGHGHNYRVEPCVETPLVGPNEAPPFTLADLERLTHDLVIKRFDHTHLNTDTREFATGVGLNPSVENIAKVCYNLLAPAVGAAGQGVKLRSVTVWETDKTCCVYPG